MFVIINIIENVGICSIAKLLFSQVKKKTLVELYLCMQYFENDLACIVRT